MENIASLTPREIEFGRHLINGISVKKIAQMLNISLHTAEHHQKNIKRKVKATGPCHVGALLQKMIGDTFDEGADNDDRNQ